VNSVSLKKIGTLSSLSPFVLFATSCPFRIDKFGRKELTEAEVKVGLSVSATTAHWNAIYAISLSN